MTHNCLTYIYCWLGACKIGCVVNPPNSMLKPSEIEYIVNDAGSRVFFVEDMLVPQALEAACTYWILKSLRGGVRDD